MTFLRHSAALLSRICQAVSTFLLVVIVALNAANVCGRYLFNAPIGGAEEVLVDLMIVAVFLAFPAVTFDGAHVRMDLLVHALPPRARSALQIVADILGLAVAVVMVVATVPTVMMLIEFDQWSDSGSVPLALPQSVIPFGFAAAILCLIARLASGAHQAPERAE
jgi:TRAP-type C4-dicarboxylate transport system permease small subunit